MADEELDPETIKAKSEKACREVCERSGYTPCYKRGMAPPCWRCHAEYLKLMKGES